jgi:hypothetical protein
MFRDKHSSFFPLSPDSSVWLSQIARLLPSTLSRMTHPVVMMAPSEQITVFPHHFLVHYFGWPRSEACLTNAPGLLMDFI